MTEYEYARVGGAQIQGAAVADTGSSHALDPAALRSEDRTAHAAPGAEIDPRVEVAATVISEPSLEDQRSAERCRPKLRREGGRSRRGLAGRCGASVCRCRKGFT